MTELDWYPPVTENVVERPPKRHRHVWERREADIDGTSGRSEKLVWHVCTRCFLVRDETQSRRGRSSRRLGHDGERRSRDRYGWRRTGQFGGPDDLVGTLAIVQQKTTRGAPPRRWQQILDRLEGMAAGRTPLLLLSYVRHGVPTEDFIVLRGRDWLALHGLDEPPA